MEYYEGQHKDRSLSDCMLLVAQRLTKYPVLVEQIHPKDRIDFSFDNLFWPVKNDSTITLTNSTKTIGRRQILLITRAFWRETMNGPELELRLLLCDDIIVFLRLEGGGGGSSTSIVNVRSNSNAANTKLPPLQFFRHISHSGVLPLYSNLVRGENVQMMRIMKRKEMNIYVNYYH